MIKAADLRVGNIYLRKHGKGWTEIVIDENIIGKIFSDSNEYALDDFEPIRLIPEWLEIMGCSVQIFEGEDGALVTMAGLFVCQPFYQKDHSLSISHAPKARRLRYVHEFQNYYLDLTGEELTIKEITA